jgi:anti-anti-sigma factor
MTLTQSAIDGVTIFHMEGYLDSITSAQLQLALVSAVSSGAHRLALDFNEVGYVSSAGLRVVLMMAKQARAAGGEMAIFGLGNPVRETFEISGFARVIAIVTSQTEAVRVVQGG